MATFKLPVLDYDNRDFTSIRDDGIARVGFFTPEWTDLNPDDLGVVLWELLAGMGDVNHYYVDRQANEGFLATALTRRAVRLILEPLGIRLKSAAPAKINLEFSIASALGSDLTIPAATRCRTAGPGTIVQFETDAAVVIPAGQLKSPLQAATEGDTQTEALGTSDGSQFQKFTPTLVPVIDDSWQVTVDVTVWTPVASLAVFGPTDEVYAVSRDEDDLVTIEFGDGVNGKIPTSGDSISVTARVGGGRQGNVSKEKVVVVVDTIVNGGGPVTVFVTNPAGASGGEERESLEDAKVRGPLEFGSLNRAVALPDYEGLIAAVSGVFRVQSVLASVGVIDLYIAPAGGGPPSQALIDAVQTEVDRIRMATDGVNIKAANFVPIDLTATVTVLASFVQDAVASEVQLAIDDFFDISNRPFGEVDSPVGDVRLSDIFETIEGVDGVDFTEIDVLTLVPEPEFTIATGDATFGPVSVSPTTVAETWTVVFTSPTAFNVRGSVSGLQTTTGTTGSVYTSDNGEVSFTITAGGSPMAAGDTARFRVSPLVGSVDILQTEIARKGTVNLGFTGGV